MSAQGQRTFKYGENPSRTRQVDLFLTCRPARATQCRKMSARSRELQRLFRVAIRRLQSAGRVLSIDRTCLPSCSTVAHAVVTLASRAGAARGADRGCSSCQALRTCDSTMRATGRWSGAPSAAALATLLLLRRRTRSGCPRTDRAHRAVLAQRRRRRTDAACCVQWFRKYRIAQDQ